MWRPLRDDDFTMDFTQGKKFIGILYKIFRGNCKKTYASLVSTLYLSIDGKTEARTL